MLCGEEGVLRLIILTCEVLLVLRDNGGCVRGGCVRGAGSKINI